MAGSDLSAEVDQSQLMELTMSHERPVVGRKAERGVSRSRPQLCARLLGEHVTCDLCNGLWRLFFGNRPPQSFIVSYGRVLGGRSAFENAISKNLG